MQSGGVSPAICPEAAPPVLHRPHPGPRRSHRGRRGPGRRAESRECPSHSCCSSSPSSWEVSGCRWHRPDRLMGTGISESPLKFPRHAPQWTAPSCKQQTISDRHVHFSPVMKVLWYGDFSFSITYCVWLLSIHAAPIVLLLIVIMHRTFLDDLWN